MKRMKIVVVVGARPQFIKIAMLAHKLKENFDVLIIHTGQHYDYEMSQSFFDQINIPSPDINLKVGSGHQGYQTSEMIRKLEEVYLREKPNLVIVVGDTNSTLAGALAATKLHIKIAHIEAGMRNFDRKKPEEINRVITDHISDYLFPPTENARENLAREGITESVYIVGDISNDVLLKSVPQAQRESNILRDLDLKEKEYYLLTIHKSKNTDSKENLEAILKTMYSVDFPVVFPVHPRTRKVIQEYDLGHYLDIFTVTKPLSYLDMISLMNNARKIVTDSGGMQKEAFALEVPCITTRKTEWVETLEEGWNREVDIHNGEEFLKLVIEDIKPETTRKSFLGAGDTYLRIYDILCQKKMS